MPSNYIKFEDIQIDQTLYNTVNNEIIPGTGVSSQTFWSATAELLRRFSPLNEALLKKRDRIQSQIDEYHLRNSGKPIDPVEYASFLTQIGYLVPNGPDFKVDTTNVDDEIACIPGPQLVVPVDNARYALNAANARWGSLLDAFYGTDAGPSEENGAERGRGYNPVRGKRVFEYAHKFLDTYFPLTNNSSYNNVTSFTINNKQLLCTLTNGSTVTLVTPSKFVGFNGTFTNITSILLKNNNLHVELQIDANSTIGRTHKAGVKDIVIESAITAIADCEDSVAAVDAIDKSNVYRNWNGLMKGTLESRFAKGNKQIIRKLNPDKTFRTICGKNTFTLGGRAVLLIRNVSLHMYTDAILTSKNGRTPEGLLDLMVTTLAALHDISQYSSKSLSLRNSRHNSMYIVKPKLHGPEEVAFTINTFKFVEKIFNLKENSLKIGIMDEERRTTVNLMECIREAKYRCIFINTGFLDRTGDEIHTSFYAGPVLKKSDIKKAIWRTTYEKWNVEIGLKVGLVGNGQIGKGMWAAPNAMAEMIKTKGSHPKSGATTAWVPSPTAATLHAMHYHETNVLNVQKRMLQSGFTSKLSNILIPPIMTRNDINNLTRNDISNELENNVQGILGYVVRWIELGIGCSTVPDINDIGLMEDRATLRISSQHIANWLFHGIITKEDVFKTFERMSKIVDRQNSKQAGYKAMFGDFERNNGFQCALELVFNGKLANNGLTETSLTKFRQKEKARNSRSNL